ncbi:hypothetical protein C7382_10318 [Porphyromonas loveana]|uniref:Uncharacterized protein n=1 Tax=Porphyromonas loveana TaxID=1884669 RepID=A0A2U1FM97_9PORP|nr:hypothetical protein C7382_10318 [Porphyromonas loveana]
MELRIIINNRRKQFTGIGRGCLSDSQDNIKHMFPYLFRSRQFESVTYGFMEEYFELVNLQFSFFSISIFIWLGHVFMHSIILITVLISRSLIFIERCSQIQIISIPLHAASRFALYRLTTTKIIISCGQNKFEAIFDLYLNYTGATSLPKL